MDWITKMNESLEYIEENLEEGPDIVAAGRIAGCSAYHFQRVFSYMAGITLGEYLRRRRLSKAAVNLQSGAKVIDVALKYGYDSPTAFTRAFTAQHGFAPSKGEGAVFVSYPPISFTITIRGVSAMNYRIEKMDAIRIVGTRLHTSMINDENIKLIPEFWQKTAQTGAIPRMCQLMDAKPMGVLGVSVGDWEASTDFDYYIAVASGQPVPEGFEEYTIPASTYAIFECVGPMPSAIQELSKRIMTEWLPGSGYQYGNGADIEVYSDGDSTAPDYKCWVWLPVTPKEC